MGPKKAGRPSVRVERRREVLAVALQIIAENGIAAFQIIDITRRLGLSPGALYRHFDGRDEVIVEVQRVALRELVAAFEEELARADTVLPRPSTPPVNALARILVAADRYLALPSRMPAHFALISHSLAPPEVLVPTPIARTVVPAMESLLGLLRRLLVEAAACKAMDAGDASARALDLWAALHGVSQTAKLDRLEPAWAPARERGLRVARCMLRGWGARSRTVTVAQARAERARSKP